MKVLAKRTLSRGGVGSLYALPAIIGFLLFSVVPIIYSLVLSFTDYTVTNKAKFIGWENFRYMFTEDVYFWNSLKVTFSYILMYTPLSLLVSFLLALLLTTKSKSIWVFRTLFYIPNIVPFIATSVLWLYLFNPDYGLLNQILEFIGLDGIRWIYSEQTVLPSLILMKLWTVGGTTLIFLAALMNVPTELFDSVEVDGGRYIHKVIHVMLPTISPVIFFNLVMTLIGAVQTFTEAYVMTEGGPGTSSYFYGYHVYKTAFAYGEFGAAAALSWVLMLISITLTIVVFKWSKSWIHY